MDYSVLAKYGQYKHDIFSKLGFPFEAGKLLLDVGCGDGTDAEIFAKVFGLTVYGIDQYAHSNLINVPEMQFKNCSVYNILHPTGMFDYVFLHDLLHHVDEKQQLPENHYKALREIKRVCKDGGTIIIVEANRFNPIFYPHMVLMEGHNNFTQKYFCELVRNVFPNAQFSFFESHFYPARFLSFFRKYEKLMECYAPKKFLAYNIAIVTNRLFLNV